MKYKECIQCFSKLMPLTPESTYFNLTMIFSMIKYIRKQNVESVTPQKISCPYLSELIHASQCYWKRETSMSKGSVEAV